MSLEQLIQKYWSPIGLALERLGVARSDVDDVRQRVWLTLSRYMDKLQPGSERAFLFAVARREAGHTRRSYRRRAEVTRADFDEFVSSALAGEELVHRRQLLERAQAVLQEMEHDLRVVLVLAEVDEASAREVAARLDIPIGTVKSRLRRARADCPGRALATTAARASRVATSPRVRREPRRASVCPGAAARSAVG
jgi:RNA polymerase sigma-70 factor, ECF subfamily